MTLSARQKMPIYGKLWQIRNFDRADRGVRPYNVTWFLI